MLKGYIGHGNPTAKILFIGQDPAIDPETDVEEYQQEIVGNAEHWRNIISNHIGYELIDHSKIQFGSPLHPWANQKFQVRNETQKGIVRGENGTSRTWYNYQKVINKIMELYSENRKTMTKDDYLDFHRMSFHTDMSDATSKKHSNTLEGRKSVIDRVSLLSTGFFRNFPIVIAAVGHFPRDTYGDSYFGDLFNVDFLGNESSEQSEWMNISIRNSPNNPMLLIHTPQFSAAISDQYLDKMARHVVDFAHMNRIDLLPEE